MVEPGKQRGAFLRLSKEDTVVAMVHCSFEPLPRGHAMIMSVRSN